MRRIMVLLCAILLCPSAAHSVVYYFSTSGDDAHDGLSENRPKKSLIHVPALLSPGTSVLLKRGDAWYEDQLQWNFDSKPGSPSAPMLVGAYGTGPRPVVAAMLEDVWTRDSTGLYSGVPRWVHYPADTADRVYRLYLGEQPIPRVSCRDSLLDSTYCVATGRVYVRCDAGDSTLTVEYMRDSQPIVISNVDYLTFSDLELKGGAHWVAIRATAPNSHLKFTNVHLHQFMSYGIEFMPPTSGDTLPRNVDVEVVGCTIDKGWSARMNYEPHYTVVNMWGSPETWGAAGGDSQGDGIAFNSSVDTAVVRGCYVTNTGHAGIANQIENQSYFGTRHLLIEQNVVTAGTSIYGRSVGIGGSERCRMNVIRRNYFRDQNIRSVFLGESTFVYSNIFATTKVSPFMRLASAMASYSSGPDNLVNRCVVKHCVFANNTFADADAFLEATAFAHPDAGPLWQDNRFSNNLMSMWRTVPKGGVERNTPIVIDSVAAGSWSLEGNGFWKSPEDTTVLMVCPEVGETVEYSVSMLNGRPGCGGNMVGDPLFASGDSISRFSLSATSPYVSSGVALSELLPAGLEAVDYYGRPFGLTPSAGAIQYPFTGLESVAIAGAPGGPIAPGAAIALSAALTPIDADVRTYAWTVVSGPDTVTTGTQAALTDTLTVPATYSISLAVVDKLGYVRAASPVNVVVARDTIPPAAVTDLEIVSGGTSAGALWTAPGDDGVVGRASGYDLRSSEWAIDEANFASATSVATEAPDTAGTRECAIASGLHRCKIYYFAMKTVDEAGNWSALSNVVMSRTRCTGSFEVFCEEGGWRATRSGEEEPARPVWFALHQNEPNPFAGETNVRFDLPVRSHVRLEVFDAQGRLVRTLASGDFAAGYQSLRWDQRNNAGDQMKPGVYVYRMKAGPFRAQRKMVLLP